MEVAFTTGENISRTEFNDHEGVMFFENADQVTPCPIILRSDEDRIEVT